MAARDKELRLVQHKCQTIHNFYNNGDFYRVKLLRFKNFGKTALWAKGNFHGFYRALLPEGLHAKGNYTWRLRPRSNPSHFKYHFLTEKVLICVQQKKKNPL